MFEANESNAKKLDALVALCGKLNRGDYLDHPSIEAILGIPRHSAGWFPFIKKLRRRLEAERGISLWCERNIGYELLTVDRQLMVPIWRGRRAGRQMAAGVKAVDALPSKGLTAHQRRVLAFRLDKAQRATRALRREIREIAVITRPSEGLPRPRREATGTEAAL